MISVHAVAEICSATWHLTARLAGKPVMVAERILVPQLDSNDSASTQHSIRQLQRSVSLPDKTTQVDEEIAGDCQFLKSILLI